VKYRATKSMEREMESMVNELQARLHSLYNSRTPLGGIDPQTVGFERYRLVASGAQLYTLLEAADRIGALEATLREISILDDASIARILALNALVPNAGLNSQSEAEAKPDPPVFCACDAVDPMTECITLKDFLTWRRNHEKALVADADDSPLLDGG